jgi:hypothetical protein
MGLVRAGMLVGASVAPHSGEDVHPPPMRRRNASAADPSLLSFGLVPAEAIGPSATIPDKIRTSMCTTRKKSNVLWRFHATIAGDFKCRARPVYNLRPHPTRGSRRARAALFVQRSETLPCPVSSGRSAFPPRAHDLPIRPLRARHLTCLGSFIGSRRRARGRRLRRAQRIADARRQRLDCGPQHQRRGGRQHDGASKVPCAGPLWR